MNKLYEKDSYLRENTTTVTYCRQVDNGYIIHLDETVFFPEEGGQYADSGFITLPDGSTAHILDARVNGDEIDYIVDTELDVGISCRCTLDWDLRFMRMQQHSGEHILSGLLYRMYGFNNVGFHLSDVDYVTLDTSGVLTATQISELEMLANEIVYSNVPIFDSYPDKDLLDNIQYRSKKAIDGQVRLITIGNSENIVDICACCAPHVNTTAQIGIIKIFNYINYKGGMRIQFLCGKRAFAELCGEHEIIKNVALGFSTASSNIEKCISDLKAELVETKTKLSRIIENDLISQINNMKPDDIPCIFLDDVHGQYMKAAYNTLTIKYPDKYVGVFLGDDVKGYRYHIGNPKLDSLLIKEQLTQISAKGGGNSDMLQGKALSDANTIADFFLRI